MLHLSVKMWSPKVTLLSSPPSSRSARANLVILGQVGRSDLNLVRWEGGSWGWNETGLDRFLLHGPVVLAKGQHWWGLFRHLQRYSRGRREGRHPLIGMATGQWRHVGT